MGKDLAQNTTGTQLSAADKKAIDAEIKKNAAALRESLSKVGNKISLKDKQFKFPNGQPLNGPIDLIVVEWSSQNLYYKDAYDSNNPVPPDCFASAKNPEDLAPDASIKQPMHSECAGCSMNMFKSAPNGKGKACKNTRLIVVRKPGEPDLYTISLSPTSIAAFDKAMLAIISTDTQPLQFVISVDFHPDVSWPQLIWKDPRPNEEYHGDFMTLTKGISGEMLALKPL